MNQETGTGTGVWSSKTTEEKSKLVEPEEETEALMEETGRRYLTARKPLF